MNGQTVWPGTETWEFFEDRAGVFFGPMPPGGTRIDLIHHRRESLDTVQYVTATAYLDRVGRSDDAAQLFATQAGCTLEDGRLLLREPKPPARPEDFPPPPWPISTADATLAEARSRRLWAIAILVVGVGVPLALIALVVFLIAI